MPSLQEQRRNLIVHFLNRIRGVDPEWRKVTAAHFVAEGIPKKTVYDIIKRYLVRGTVERRRGSGRPARKMKSRNRQRLKRMVNHKTGLSQRALASTFGCSQAYICKVIKKLKIAYRQRMKVPKYKDPAAMREARKRCRILYRKFRLLHFVIDDEKYFGLSGFQMSGNRGYYTSDFAQTPMALKTYAKKKFEPKVMLWIAMSPEGLSSPVLTSGRSMAVTARSYVDNCLEPHLLPFLNNH